MLRQTLSDRQWKKCGLTYNTGGVKSQWWFNCLLNLLLMKNQRLTVRWVEVGKLRYLPPVSR